MISFALSLVFVTLFVRALPWPMAWKGRKPLACDACCVGWPTSFVFVFGLRGSLGLALLEVLGGAGLAMLLLALHGYLKASLAPPE